MKQMDKRSNTIAIIIIAVLLVAGTAALTYSNKQNDQKDAERMAMQKTDGDAMKMDEAMQKSSEVMTKEDSAMQKTDVAMTQTGSYSTYNLSKLANAEKGDVVLFFHAGWCPKCKETDKNFNATQTPDGLTILKIDYDNSTELRKKYGVTIQHTFVQVDKDGNELKQWNGSYTYDDIKAQVN